MDRIDFSRSSGIALLLLLTSCTPAPTPDPSDAPIEALQPKHAIVDGLQVPGTAVDAKRMGFTVCEAHEIYMDCKRDPLGLFLGVPIVAADVQLNAADNSASSTYSSLPPLKGKTIDDLSFDSIRLGFAAPTYDEKCVDRAREGHTEYVPEPDECAKPGSIAAVRLALKREGWMECRLVFGCSRRDTDYYKKGVPIEISEALRYGNQYEITLTARSVEEVNQILIDMAEWEQKQAYAKRAAQSLEDQMRK